MADVALTVVVKLDEDKVHALHCVERNGCVWTWALGRGGDVVLFGGIGVHCTAERGDEVGVEGGAVVFVVYIRMYVSNGVTVGYE